MLLWQRRDKNSVCQKWYPQSFTSSVCVTEGTMSPLLCQGWAHNLILCVLPDFTNILTCAITSDYTCVQECICVCTYVLRQVHIYKFECVGVNCGSCSSGAVHSILRQGLSSVVHQAGWPGLLRHPRIHLPLLSNTEITSVSQCARLFYLDAGNWTHVLLGGTCLSNPWLVL